MDVEKWLIEIIGGLIVLIVVGIYSGFKKKKKVIKPIKDIAFQVN